MAVKKLLTICILLFLFFIIFIANDSREILKMSMGSWNIGPVNIPDLHLSENLFNRGTYANQYSTPQGPVQQIQPTQTMATASDLQNAANAGNTYTPVSTGGGSYSGSSIGGSSGGSSGGQQTQTGPTDAELINDMYKSSINSLDTQQAGLYANQQNMYDTATNPYTGQIPLVQQAGQQGQNAIQGQQNTAGIQTQNAINAATKLYNELMSRNRQAFGSGALSSVGQATGEILGRSAQEQFGNIRTSGDTTLQQLQTASRDLQEKTTVQVNQLELQKASALAQAKQDFQDRLDYITQQKDVASQTKATNKLSLMQDYRSNIQNIQNQANQLRASIAAQAAANGQNVQAQINAFNQGWNNTVDQGNTGLYNQGQAGQSAVTGIGTSNAASAASPATTLSAQGVTGSFQTKRPEDYTNTQSFVGSMGTPVYDASGRVVRYQ